MKYDVIIIGAGVIGATVARCLSKYDLKVLVLEKGSDVGDETSGANSAIVHSGYDPHPGTLKASLNVRGNKLFPALCRDLDVEFSQIGSLTVATCPEEEEILGELYGLGLQNGLLAGTELRIVGAEELRRMEPFVTKKATAALWAPTAAIVNPFELVVALMENAMDNGVELHLDEEVTAISKPSSFVVTTTRGSYESSLVINCAGVASATVNNMISPVKERIRPRKGEYFVLDHFTRPYVSHTLFSVPSSKGKGVLVSPTTHGNYLIGPSSEFVESEYDKGTDKATLDNVLKEAYRLVDEIPMQYLIRQFSGLRSYHDSGDFVIGSPVEGFINLLGIQSPGLASSPAIGEKVEAMVSAIIDLRPREGWNPRRRPLYRINALSAQERRKLIDSDPSFGRMVCRCEQVSAGEVIDSIRRNCGARTVKGVKKRVRPGFGKCQGGFCEPLIIKILARELGRDPNEIRLSGEGSWILEDKL